MAIGARISSTNLSGKTATVTFTPYTGSTSGSTVNLGTQTIPFNNITSHPYGNYAIYLAEYDYTYTLEVPEPNYQSAMVISQISNSNNWGNSVLNFDDLTATLIDLGVDSTLYYVDNLFPIQDSGYGVYFTNRNNWEDKIVAFLDYKGDVIHQESIMSNNFNTDSLDGKFVTFTDYVSGTFKYFDGETVYSYNWNPSMYYFDIDWNNYAVTKNNTILIDLRDQITNEKSTYILDKGEIILLETWNDNSFNRDYMICPTHTFIPSIERQVGSWLYKNLRFFGTDGVQIGTTIDLTGTPYNNYNYRQYGENRFCIIFWDNNDNATPYYIVHFDGNTQNVITDTHARGNEYNNISTYGNDKVGTNSYQANAFAIVFYNQLNWYQSLMETSYYDAWVIGGNATAFTKVEFANNADPGVKYIGWPSIGENDVYIAKYDSQNDTNLKYTIINGNGSSEIDTNVALNNAGINSYINLNPIEGIGLVGTILVQNSWDYIWAFVQPLGGNVTSNISMALDGSWNFSNNWMTGVYTITNHYTTYITNTTTENGFVELGGFWYNWNRNAYYQKSNHLSDSNIILVNTNNMTLVVATSTSYINPIELPAHNGSWDLALGKDNFLYVYGNDADNGYTTFALYDMTGVLIRTYTTPFNFGWDRIRAVKDRYYVTLNDDNNIRKTYLIAPHMIQSTTTGTGYGYDDVWNDWLSWWD